MDFFSNSEIKKILRLNIGRQTLLKAEEEGRIPNATRVQRGNLNIRKWKISDIPEIGRKYGKLKSPDTQRVISFFTGKGGVLKSTLAFNFGRTLALNGIKTLLIGLDIQESITTLALGHSEYENIKDIRSTTGLYDFFKNNMPLKDIIKETNLPTLHVLPRKL